MNQIKIGKFIAECRKEKNLTQSSLAEHFGISDRAVSKWETGRCLPDAGIMVDLCNLLDISVNELLLGEKINMENYEKKAEENLVELKKRNEVLSRYLLQAETIIMIFAMLFLLGTFFGITLFKEKGLNLQLNISNNWLITAGIISFVAFIISSCFCIKFEAKAGYYKCTKCGTVFEPDIRQVFFAPHIGLSRNIPCPTCQKRTWAKKELSTD